MQNGAGELEKDTECLYCDFSPPLPKGGGNSRKNSITRGAVRKNSREAQEHDF